MAFQRCTSPRATLIWTAVLVLFLWRGTGVASADPVRFSRRMLQTPSLPDCSVTSCPIPFQFTSAQLALCREVPDPPGGYVCGTVTGDGFNTNTDSTSLYKQAFFTTEGLSFSVTLSGSRYHIAHVAAHCADIAASVNNVETVRLPACVNPDGVIFLVIGVFNTLKGVVPQLALLEVLYP